MPLKPIIIILVFIFGFIPPLWSQSPQMRHYTVDQGLPNSEVYHVLQDSKGYMWFATNFGVSCYDGYTFKNFSQKDGLPENTVFEIYEDYKGRIWFIPMSNQLSYFFEGKIHQYKFNQGLKKYLKPTTLPIKLSFSVDSADNIRFSTNNSGVIQVSNAGSVSKLFEFKCQPGSTHYTIEDKSSAVFIYRHWRDDNNPVCEKFDRDICLYGDDLKKSYYQLPANSKNFNSPHHFVIKKKNGDYILFIGHFLSSIRNNIMDSRLIEQRSIWLSSASDGGFWLGTQQEGLFYFSATNYTAIPDKIFLKGKSVSSVCENADGGLWITTLDDGVFYAPNFHHVSFSKNDGLLENKITSIAVGDTAIYLASPSKNVQYVNPMDYNIGCINIPPDKYSSIVNHVCFNKADKNLWVSSDYYVYQVSSNGIRFIRNYIKSGNALIANPYTAKRSLACDDGSAFVASSFGLYKLKNGKELYNSIENGQFKKRITSLCFAADSSLVIGTSQGVWSFKNNAFSIIGDRQMEKIRVTDILSLGDCMAVATKDSGLVFFKNGRYLRFNTEHGLSSNFVTALFNSRKFLWVATNMGLNKINISNIEKPVVEMVYTVKHGLISNEINAVSGQNNFLYLATNSGFTILDTLFIKPNSVPPPVYLTGVKLMQRDTDLLAQYILPYNRNYITIDFVGLCYHSSSETRYKIKMEGLDNDWKYTKIPRVEYAFLPPGNYRFLVYAINEDGMCSTTPATVQFFISPPFWKTWWFIALALICLAAIIWAVFTYRVREVRHRASLKDELNMYMQQALTKQMNPHFIFNSLNSIHNFILENDKRASSKYLSKFSRLMRIVLDNSRQQTVSLDEEISALTLYMELEALRFKDRFLFDITVSPDVDSFKVRIPPLLIQPYIENAIWHGIMHKQGLGRVDVTFTKNNGLLLCTIVDDGIGRAKAAEIKASKPITHKSVGTSITEKRIHLLNSLYNTKVDVVFTDLFDSSGNVAGTKVEIGITLIEDNNPFSK